MSSSNDQSTSSPSNDMVIFDPAMEINGLHAVWRSGNVLMAYASAGHPNESGTGFLHTSQDPHPKLLHEVKWSIDMHGPIGRKLVNESHLVFAAAQPVNEEPDASTSNRPQLLKLSRNYRSILRSCFLELRHTFGENAEIGEELENQMRLYSIMELIWSLCEILFIENLPDGVVILQLVEWCKWHFPVADELVTECMDDVSEISPCHHHRYWHAIYALVLQGRVSEARDMLKLHPSYQTQSYDAFSSIDELMRKMPSFQHQQGQSLNEFEMKWRHWHDECIMRLHNGDFDTNAELKTICKILCGDEEVIEDLSELSGAWYQMLVSYLFYKNPSISVYDLHYHSKACIDMFGGTSQFGPLDNILLAAFKFDVSQVIRECCSSLSSWWLPAHLADILHAVGLLPPSTSESGGDLREHLIVEYANSLASEECMWSVVSGYLAHCGPFSSHYLPMFVRRIPLSSERKATKVLKLCSKHGLSGEAQSVCRQMARRALQYNRMGTALSWSIKANDSSFVIRIADKMLLQYARTGAFPNIDVVDHLGPAVLMSERLTFLAKYRDFHKLYANEEFKPASTLLLNLLVHGKSPPHFWLSLLMDCLPLLEKDELYYDADAACGLLNRLNALHRSKEAFADLTEAERESGDKKMEDMRLALSNYLARAIVS